MPDPLLAGAPEAPQTPDPDRAESASTPEPPDESPDWFGGNPLAELGVVIPISDCVDCELPTLEFARLTLPLGGILLGSGGGGGGAGAGGGIGGPVVGGETSNNLIELSPQVGSGGGHGSTGSNGPAGEGGGNPPTITPSPGGPSEPGPKDPEVVPVPEPAALVLAGFGVISYVIRERRSRKRRA